MLLTPPTCHKLSHFLGRSDPLPLERDVLYGRPHSACAHDMSIRPIQVEVTMYLGQTDLGIGYPEKFSFL